tara:strand:- start:741 stop:2531 length:1791 start_codon:yes stop_codon:yes gene_type:complete
MLLTRFIPKSPEDEILKGMGVVRYIDGDLHSMIHPPEESINPEGEDHPAFHHDGQGNLLPAETGAHPIDGVIKMLDSRLEEYRAALSERAQQGDETAARLLQELQGWTGGALVDEAIRLHNQKHPNQPLPPKDSPEYRKNTIDIYPDRDKKGNVFLNDGNTLVNYWSNKGIPSGKDPGYGYESGAIHFGSELHDILNNSAFMQAVRYLAQTGTPISGMNDRTPPEMLTSQAHLQQDMGRNYINPHLLSSHPGHEIHRFPTRKSGKLDMSEMAGRFGFEDQMHHPEGLHASQIMHHLPYEFFSKDGRAMNTESIAKEISGIMQHPDVLNHFSQVELPSGATLADYNTPEGISALAEYISRKPATKLLFGGRAYTQGETGSKKGSQVYNMVKRIVGSLDEQGLQNFHAHKQSMGQSASHRGVTSDIAALANVFGPHADSGDRAHFHANTDNHEEEKDARFLIEHLARGHMIANGLDHHTPRPEQPTGVPHYEPTRGVPYEQLVGSHNRNLAQQGVYGHTPPAPAPEPVPKEPSAQLDLGALYAQADDREKELARRWATGEPTPDGTLTPWMKTTSAGWDSAKALARSDELRKFWKCVR